MGHEILYPGNWTGYLQVFMLWINLPAARKMEDPMILNCAPHKLPVVELSQSPRATAKVLIGENVYGVTSPMKTPSVPVTYVDFVLEAGAKIHLDVPLEQSGRFLYIHHGSA